MDDESPSATGNARKSVSDAASEVEEDDDEHALMIDEKRREGEDSAVEEVKEEKPTVPSNSNAFTSKNGVNINVNYVDRSVVKSRQAALTASVDKCDYCKDDEIYDDNALLKLHIRQNHPYRCAKCFVDFASAQARYEHLVNCARFMEKRKGIKFSDRLTLACRVCKKFIIHHRILTYPWFNKLTKQFWFFLL